MVESVAASWFLRGEALVIEILQGCISSDNGEARTIARDVINKFGESGDYSYRDLLDY